MCGRYVLHSRDKIRLPSLRTVAESEGSELPFEPHYNIAPTQTVLAIANFGMGIEARLINWGLVPSWSTEGKPFINARAETLEQRPSFSDSFRLRRCLIPADGFFEWKRSGREKRPFYFQARDESLLMFAGIWDAWRKRDQLIVTCAIVTTPANELVAELHNRMPAILAPEVQEAWLNPATNRVDLLRMLTPFPASQMKTYQVSSKVNSPENDTVELLQRVDVEVGQTLSLF
jgi:putative SOS response-associated peptidase YedK